MIYQNNFRAGLADFVVESEPGKTRTIDARDGVLTIDARDGVLTIDVAGGCTVWLARQLEGPVEITYTATAVAAGGPNDRVSDLNCFWMAFDPRHPGDLFAAKRGGTFAEYDVLRTYYVGYGGNANTTTRFRRYVGEKANRPLLPEHDRGDAAVLLKPNVPVRVRLVADGQNIAFWRDGERIFQLTDPEPYTRGWFGFRTVASHLQIRDLVVSQIASR